MSFAHLSTLGICSYNGHTFDGSCNISVRVEYVPDEAERTIIYNRHTITIHGFLNNAILGVDSSGNALALRARLSHQGGPFVLTGHGFGNDLRVNVAGGMKDVKFGPKPEFLDWNPVGSDVTVEFEWQVVVCVPTCSTTGISPRTTGVMAINYGVTIDIEPRGLTTRTIFGYLEIAQTRTPGTKAIPDSADNYRHLINPPLLGSFERTSNFSFSLDKSRVDFTITDKQIGSRNPYPNGAVRIEGTHRAMWRRGGKQNHHNISLTIDTAIGTPRTLAWDYFLAIIAQRLNVIRTQSQTTGNRLWIDALEVEEELFGTSSSFSISYRVLKSIQTVFGDTSYLDFPRQGLWQPIAGTDWRQWSLSLQNVQSNGGLARLRVPSQADLIIDLCGSNSQIPWNTSLLGPGPEIRNTRPALRNEQPPPNQSFLEYRTAVEIDRQTATMHQSPMQAPQTDSTPSGDESQFRPQGMSFPPPNAQSSATPPVQDIIQQSGIPRYAIRLFGGAERAGYEIPQPRLSRVGNQTPVESAARFVCEQVGIIMGVPVFRALWDITYEVAFPPGNVSPPRNLEN